MNKQYHPFQFLNKITSDDGLLDLKEEFKNSLDQFLDTYDDATETATILDRDALYYPLHEDKITKTLPFVNHFEELLKKDEVSLLNYIQTRFISIDSETKSDLFINRILKQVNGLKKSIKTSPYRQTIIETLNRIEEFAGQLNEERDQKDKTFSMTATKEKLQDFQDALEKSDFIEKKFPFPYFRQIFQGPTVAKKIVWTTDKQDLAFLIKSLSRTKEIKFGPPHFWKIPQHCFILGKDRDDRLTNLKDQHEPSDPAMSKILSAIKLLM